MLTRHRGEAIVINGNVVIRIIRIDRNSVSLGFDAPRDQLIYREEVYQRMAAEKLAKTQAKEQTHE